MRDGQPMVEVLRGGMLESLHAGHAVIAGPDGEPLSTWGVPDTTIFPRSSCKMLQALPLVESGAAEDLSSERLALACASHEGEEGHVRRVSDWLSDMGLGEGDLLCGPQPSRDPELRRRMIREDREAGPLFNNCSGKHSGFLMLARHLGAGPDYVDPDHPVQRAVREAQDETTGVASPGYGVDGCSAPNFATTLTGLARAMSRFATAREDHARGRAMLRLRHAMAAHPWLVAGSERACTRLMEACEGRAVVKTGAEGVYVAILPETGRGIALKIADGATRASEIAMAALLVREGALDPAHPVARHYAGKPVTNRAGHEVGIERPAPGFPN